MGNNLYVMQLLQARTSREVQAFIGLAAQRHQGLRAEARQPRRRRGLEEPSQRQRHGARRERRSLRRHAAADHRGLARRRERARAAAPGAHPLQQPGHARQLGDDARNDEGRWKATAATSRTSSSTATAAAKATRTPSTRRCRPLAEYVNAHPNLTVDVGQVMFGETTSMTGDGRSATTCSTIYRRQVVQRRHRNGVRLRHRADQVPEQALVHALQWAIGLEWYLLVEDPWRVVMSTDHPNGGSFLGYPQIIRLLMDRTYRQEQIRKTCTRRRWTAAAAAPTWTASTRWTRSPSSPAPARRGSWASRTRATSASAPTPTSRSTRDGRQGGDVRGPAVRHQGRRSSSSRTASCVTVPGRLLQVAPSTIRASSRHRAAVRGLLQRAVLELPGGERVPAPPPAGADGPRGVEAPHRPEAARP